MGRWGETEVGRECLKPNPQSEIPNPKLKSFLLLIETFQKHPPNGIFDDGCTTNLPAYGRVNRVGRGIYGRERSWGKVWEGLILLGGMLEWCERCDGFEKWERRFTDKVAGFVFG
jgi:hypothetical protein